MSVERGIVGAGADQRPRLEFYGQRIRGLQLVHAGKRGRWPWDQGVRGGQPVLGTREPPERRQR